MKEVCAQCPTLSADQIKRIDDARRFGKGIQYARQWLLASYDMALVGEKPEPALAAWKRLDGDTPLGHVEGSLFPAAFSHIAGGYGAGYYGYMWSQVMALDMLSGFKGNLMDPAAGKRYRDAILARGGEVHPSKLVRAFLGREPNSQAFFAEITGKR
jgi:thimet oligopeptidase